MLSTNIASHIGWDPVEKGWGKLFSTWPWHEWGKREERAQKQVLLCIADAQGGQLPFYTSDWAM